MPWNHEDVFEFLESVGETTGIQVFVGHYSSKRPSDDTIFVWVRAMLPEPTGPKGRPHREHIVAEFDEHRYKDPLLAATKEARRLQKIMARRGYQAELI